MRIILKIATFLWLACWLYAGVSLILDTPDQMASDRKFIEKEIKPSVDFVKNFKANHGRLPTYRAYYTWQRAYYKDYSGDLTQSVDSLIPGLGTKQYIRKLTDVVGNDHHKFKHADWNKDFAIGVWRGEWTEYYFSWTDRYDSNEFAWSDGFMGFAFMIGVGIFPLLFWWLNHSRISTQS